jgi:hypothetical protein
VLSPTAQLELDYAKREAPKRGGFIWEGAREAYEAGTYKDEVLDELLAAGAIVAHPLKGWMISQRF